MMAAIAIWFKTLLARAMAFFFLLSPGMNAQLAPAPVAAPAPKPTQSKTQTLKVMSFNVWVAGSGELAKEKRLPWVAQTILDELPDVVGLQEASEFWRNGLPEALKEHYCMTWNFGRDNWKGQGEGTPILFLRAKYRLIDQGFFWLREKPLQPGNAWEASLNRMAAWALLQDKTTGFAFLAVNTHLDHQSDLARSNGAALISAFINKMNLPTVLTGDMNNTPASTPIQYFKQAGLIHTAEAAQTAEGARTFHGYGSGNIATGEPIDFVFANGYLDSAARYRVLHGQFDGHYPSDHFAIVSELTLKG